MITIMAQALPSYGDLSSAAVNLLDIISRLQSHIGLDIAKKVIESVKPLMSIDVLRRNQTQQVELMDTEDTVDAEPDFVTVNIEMEDLSLSDTPKANKTMMPVFTAGLGLAHPVQPGLGHAVRMGLAQDRGRRVPVVHVDRIAGSQVVAPLGPSASASAAHLLAPAAAVQLVRRRRPSERRREQKEEMETRLRRFKEERKRRELISLRNKTKVWK